MKKTILILNSPLFEYECEQNSEDYLPPLGLGIIASNLREYNLKFIDLIAENISLNRIIFLIQKIKPDFILSNIFTTNYSLVRKIVEKSAINTHWIIGGISTKQLYKRIFQWDTLSPITIVYGDGELIINDAINSSISEEPKDKLNNREFFLVDIKSKYYVHDISNEELDRTLFKNEPQINYYNESEIGIYASRGCPFNCAYCVAASSRNRELSKPRQKNSDSIVKELKSIERQYPSVTAVRILDDLFFRRKESFAEATSIFSNFNFNWRAMCHIRPLSLVDNSDLENLRGTGCKELFIGIESGSSRILKYINKTKNTILIEETIKRTLRAGVNVKGYFILGFPTETEMDMEKTFELASRLTNYAPQHTVSFRNSTFMFRPYWGTDLTDDIFQNDEQSKELILQNTNETIGLSNGIRNRSFDFDSGNYSEVNDAFLECMIRKMELLNV